MNHKIAATTAAPAIAPALARASGRRADGPFLHWADTLEADRLVRLGTYRGKNGMTTLLPQLAGADAGLVSVYCDKGSAYLQFWRSVFERRAPQSILAAEAAASTEIRQRNTTREVTGQLLEALAQAYREAAAMTSQ